MEETAPEVVPNPKHEDAASSKRGSRLAIAEAKQQKLRMRLDAEASVGVSSALVGGFALSLVPEGVLFRKALKDSAASSSSAESLSAAGVIFVCCMAACGCLCLLTVITSGTIYWAGNHLLSATKVTVDDENDLFRRMWKMREVRIARHCARRAFQLSCPVFLAGINALMYTLTGSVAITVLLGCLFALTVALACWLTYFIEGYTLKVTATA